MMMREKKKEEKEKVRTTRELAEAVCVAISPFCRVSCVAVHTRLVFFARSLDDGIIKIVFFHRKTK